MTEPISVPVPTKETIGRHLRYSHGYETAYAVAEHPSVLLGQHDRVHQMFQDHKIGHVHNDEVAK